MKSSTLEKKNEMLGFVSKLLNIKQYLLVLAFIDWDFIFMLYVFTCLCICNNVVKLVLFFFFQKMKA